MRIIFIFLLIVALPLLSICQDYDRPFHPNKPIDAVSISQWTAEDGLSSNNTTRVYQDSTGLIWVTSFNGFMIYDSERFEIYDLNTLPMLETDGFYTIAEDKEEGIYLASQGSGIIKYEKGKFIQFTPKAGNIPKSVRSLTFGRDGTMYAGTNSDGLYIMKNDSIWKFDHLSTKNITIETILEDESGNIWMGTEGDGLFGIVNDSLVHFTADNGLLSEEVNDLILSSRGDVFLATNNGLQYLDRSLQLHAIESLEGIYINCLAFDSHGSVWMGGEEGLFRWNEQTGKTEWIKSKRGIDLVRISSILFDSEDNIWITSNRSGLIQIKESIVSNLSTPSISSDRIYIIHESYDGNLYIGTDRNKIDICNGNRCTSIPIKTDLNGNGVRDIFHEKDGSFWIATYSGIIKIKNNQEVVYTTKDGMPANNFRLVLKDQNDNFWFGSRSGGLVKFRDGQIKEVYGIGNKLKSNFILALQQGPTPNELFIGTHSGGMSILNTETNDVRTYHVKEDDAGVLIFNIDPMPDGTAFVTANLGPLYFDGDSLISINLRKDRRSKTFFDIVRDGFGNIWVTTNIGIMQIREEDWFSYLDGEIDEVPYFILDENSGMNNKECTGATRSTLTSENHVLFPTLGGICILNPQDVEMSYNNSNVIIRHVFADQKEYYFPSGIIEIPPGSLRFSFLFSLLSFSSPERNQFKYRLEGFEKEWSKPTYQGAVEYTNLPPGNYTFEVIGSNDGIKWSNPASFSFKVLPFFHQTLGFYLLIGFVLIGIVWGIYRWRLDFINKQNLKLKKVNAELDRFVYSASHEMRSPLSSILGLIQVLRSERERKNDEEYFRIIENSVKRLDNLIQDITDYSRNTRLELENEKFDVVNIVKNILDDISYTTNFQKVRYEIICNGESSLFSDYKRIKIVLSNIINNAFKHHIPEEREDPYVLIKIDKTLKGIDVAIEDNGPGIEDQYQEEVFKMFYRATVKAEGSGLGLYIVKETISKLKGDLTLNSIPGRGTTFRIHFPDLENLN